MTQRPVRSSLGIRLCTGGVLVLNGALYVAAYWLPAMLIGAGLVSVVILGCYLAWAPIAYELEYETLTVRFRIGAVRYGPVVRCGPLEAPICRAIGLCRNGGVFALSGIFWSKRLGIFRAYATTLKTDQLVIMETAKHKVVISPAEPQKFMAGCSGGKE